MAGKPDMGKGPEVKVMVDNKTGKEVYILEKKPHTDDLELLRLRKLGLSYKAIGSIIGRSDSQVRRRMAAIGVDDKTEQFRAHKADILEAIQAKMVSKIDDNMLKSMMQKRGLVDLAILEDKIRLIRGESTSNVASLTMVVNNASKRREDRLRSLQDSEQEGTDIVQEADIIEDAVIATTDD